MAVETNYIHPPSGPRVSGRFAPALHLSTQQGTLNLTPASARCLHENPPPKRALSIPAKICKTSPACFTNRSASGSMRGWRARVSERPGHITASRVSSPLWFLAPLVAGGGSGVDGHRTSRGDLHGLETPETGQIRLKGRASSVFSGTNINQQQTTTL